MSDELREAIARVRDVTFGVGSAAYRADLLLVLAAAERSLGAERGGRAVHVRRFSAPGDFDPDGYYTFLATTQDGTVYRAMDVRFQALTTDASAPDPKEGKE